VATFFLVLSFIGAGVEEAYVLLLDMTIIVNFIPYIYLFLALFRAPAEADEAIPGGSVGRKVCGALGTLTTAVAIAFAFVPGDASSALLFEIKLVAGVLIFVGSGLLVYRLGERRRSAS
jgi:amino acid transporter